MVVHPPRRLMAIQLPANMHAAAARSSAGCRDATRPQMRQTATSPRLSPDTMVCVGPAARVRTAAWWQNSGGAASASRPRELMPACQRRISCRKEMQKQAQLPDLTIRHGEQEQLSVW